MYNINLLCEVVVVSVTSGYKCQGYGFKIYHGE